MVAETNEAMRRMFDSFNDGVRAAVEAGQRSQQAWFKTVSGACKQPAGLDFDAMYARNERVAHEFGPFFARNFETFAGACDTGVRTSMDVFQAMCDAAGRPEEGDVYKSTRKVWDKAFDAFRSNVETAAKANARTLENCTAFMDSVFCAEPAAKASPKAGKSGGQA